MMGERREKTNMNTVSMCLLAQEKPLDVFGFDKYYSIMD